MLSNINTRLLLFSLPFLLHGTAAALSCNLPNSLVNASDTQTFIDPFRTPTGVFSGGSGEWNWTLTTQSSPPRGNDTLISQVLRLNVSPEPNLASPDLGYIGCGIIAHGLKYESRVRGQNDTSGNCGSVLNTDCQNALLSGVEYSVKTSRPGGWEPCEQLRLIGNGPNHLPKQCGDDFDRDGWLEPFPFAAPVFNDSDRTPCRFNPAASNESNAVYTWGYSTYGTANLTSYNNLTTLIEPIVTMLFADVPLNGTIDSQSKFAKAQIMCLRTGENVREGSVAAPAQVPKSESARRGASLLLISISVLLVSFGMMS